MMIIVDAAVHSKHGTVIKYDFKPGSVERYINSQKRVYLSSSQQVFPLPPTNTNRETPQRWFHTPPPIQ
jgi:hypothetical protein